MDPYWKWWIVAAVLAGAELMSNTFYLLAIALAMVMGGVAAWFGLDVDWQWAVAAVLAFVFLFIAHRWRIKRLAPVPQVSADVGKPVRVRHWNPDGSARVEYRGTQWHAELATPDTPRAESMVIVDVRGSSLILADRAS